MRRRGGAEDGRSETARKIVGRESEQSRTSRTVRELQVAGSAQAILERSDAHTTPIGFKSHTARRSLSRGHADKRLTRRQSCKLTMMYVCTWAACA